MENVFCAFFDIFLNTLFFLKSVADYVKILKTFQTAMDNLSSSI